MKYKNTVLLAEELHKRLQDTVKMVPVCNKEKDYILQLGSEEYMRTLLYISDKIYITTNDYRYEYKYTIDFSLDEETYQNILRIHREKHV